MYAATRDAMLPHTGLSDPWAAMKAMGVSSVELNFDRDGRTPGFLGYENGQPFDFGSEAQLTAFKARAAEEGVTVCALLMANDFAGDYDAEIIWAVNAVHAAKDLGATAVRVDMVPRRKDIDLDWFAGRCIEAARKILLETQGTGVALALENHGSVSNNPAFLDQIFAGVGDPRMGLTLDTGNFYWYGHPLDEVYGIMERFAPFARHTHAKNICYPAEARNTRREMGWRYKDFCCPLDQGDLDHGRIAKILQNAGYDGALVLEDESLGKAPVTERLAILKANIAYLQAALPA